MSLYGLASSSDSQVFQYVACTYGIEKHPYYHKCNDCNYSSTCEIRKAMLEKESYQKFLADMHKWQKDEKENSRILDPKSLP